jgi:hypothetical protein
MNEEQMRKRCPGAKRAGKAYITDWKLTLPFFANIKPDTGERTPAAVWEITAADEIALDRYEGFPNCYNKTEVTVDIGGISHTAMAYVMTNTYESRTDKHAPPEYKETIRHGYTDTGFNESEFSF